jgi:hypothetical protein
VSQALDFYSIRAKLCAAARIWTTSQTEISSSTREIHNCDLTVTRVARSERVSRHSSGPSSATFSSIPTSRIRKAGRMVLFWDSLDTRQFGGGWATPKQAVGNSNHAIQKWG